MINFFVTKICFVTRCFYHKKLSVIYFFDTIFCQGLVRYSLEVTFSQGQLTDQQTTIHLELFRAAKS